MAIVITEVKRGCGFRKEGGFYLKTADGSPDGILDPFVVIDPPVPTQRKAHRGPILVDGDQILARQPEDTWVVGSSARTVANKRADEYWTELFGMPLHQRLTTGECKGMESADEAYEHLLSTAMWGKSVELSIRALSLTGIQMAPGMAKLYADLTDQVIAFAVQREPQMLVKLGATAWEMYRAFPKRHLDAAKPLAQLLSALGFVKDGREMMLEIIAS